MFHYTRKRVGVFINRDRRICFSGLAHLHYFNYAINSQSHLVWEDKGWKRGKRLISQEFRICEVIRQKLGCDADRSCSKQSRGKHHVPLQWHVQLFQITWDWKKSFAQGSKTPITCASWGQSEGRLGEAAQLLIPACLLLCYERCLCVWEADDAGFFSGGENWTDWAWQFPAAIISKHGGRSWHMEAY